MNRACVDYLAVICNAVAYVGFFWQSERMLQQFVSIIMQASTLQQASIPLSPMQPLQRPRGFSIIVAWIFGTFNSVTFAASMIAIITYFQLRRIPAACNCLANSAMTHLPKPDEKWNYVPCSQIRPAAPLIRTTASSPEGSSPIPTATP